MKNIVLIVLFISLYSCNSYSQKNISQNKKYKVDKTNKEWKQLLSPMEYYVLREAGTERPFTSKLNKNYSKGIYTCTACKTPLYKSEHKYDSRSGWPSFDREIKGSIAYDVDYKIGYKRTELKCNTCGGHLGHSFDDGPIETTGKRHCINGVALEFVSKK